MRNRKALVVGTAVAALALLGAGCGKDARAGATDPSTTTTTTPPGDLHAELVAFGAGGPVLVDVPAAVLASEDAIAAWLGWYEVVSPALAADLRAALEQWESPDRSRVLIALPALGCGEDEARLVVDGSDLSVDLTGGADIRCAVAVQFATMFAVDAAALPADLTLQGEPVPDQIGPGRLVVFEPAGISPPPSTDAVILDGGTVDAWLAGLAEAGIDVSVPVRAAVAEAGGHERIVAAALQGCAEKSAELVIGPGGELRVELEANDIVCDAAETFVTAFVVPTELLPS
jgi:hypothetical protein